MNEPLTEQQRAVMTRLCRMTPKQAAEDLGISYNTVVSHVRSVRQRLGVESTDEAITRLGLSVDVFSLTTERERDVLDRLLKGQQPPAIAADLGYTRQGIGKMLRALMLRTKTNSHVALAVAYQAWKTKEVES